MKGVVEDGNEAEMEEETTPYLLEGQRSMTVHEDYAAVGVANRLGELGVGLVYLEGIE
jgi:hypothetical protein